MQQSNRAPALSRRSMLAAGAAALAFPSVALAQNLAVVKAAGVPEDSVTPALYAMQGGVFRKNGIDFQLSPQTSGSAIAAGVAGGAYNIGKSSLVALIIAHTKKIPFVLVAPGGLNQAANPIVGLVVKADSPMRTGADLNGKTIAVSSLNDLYTVSIKDWVDRHGGDSSSLKLIEMPISAVTAAVDAGRVAAGGLIDPDLQEGLDAKKIRSLGNPFDAVAPTFLYTAWFTIEDYAAKNPRVVKSFATAMREASHYTNAHHQQTIDLISKFSSVPVPVVSHMHRVNCGTSLDPKLIQPVIDACAKYKVIAAPFNAAEMIAAAVR